MKKYIVFVFSVLALTVSGMAFAECHLDGRVYNEGAVVAGYICKNGDWEAL